MLPSVGDFRPEGLQVYESVQLEAAFLSPVDELAQLSFFEELLPPDRQARLLRADAVCHIAAVASQPAVEHWVEFFVHHQDDDEKRDRLRRAEKWAVEVDLRWMLPGVLTLEVVREALQSNSRDRRWIAFPTPPPSPLPEPTTAPAQSGATTTPAPRPQILWLGDGEKTMDPELEELKARAQRLKEEARERAAEKQRRRSARLARKYGYE